MNNGISIEEISTRTTEKLRSISQLGLSRVYVKDDGHIIAVFEDDSEMDVTELFSFARHN